eukprot:UN09016
MTWCRETIRIFTTRGHSCIRQGRFTDHRGARWMSMIWCGMLARLGYRFRIYRSLRIC